MLLLFLAVSALGQLFAPSRLSLDICALGILVSAVFSAITYPFSSLLTQLGILSFGFFGRGFFSCGLLYLNEIGGDRFQAWSLTVIFAVWGFSSLLAALESIVPLPRWIWYYGLIFLPAIYFSRKLLLIWKPSPYHLHKKRMYF